MKKLNWMALGCSALLVGCMATPPSEKVSEAVSESLLPSWNQDSTQIISYEEQSAQVSLDANLWVDLMPKISDEPLPPYLLGALMLRSPEEIPAGLEIETILLAIDGETWQLNEYEVDAVTSSEWEIRLKVNIDAVESQSADVAIQLGDDNWLVQRDVAIDKVY